MYKRLEEKDRIPYVYHYYDYCCYYYQQYTLYIHRVHALIEIDNQMAIYIL